MERMLDRLGEGKYPVTGKLNQGAPLEHPHLCDECGKPRNRGNHQACSKARQEKRKAWSK